MKENGIHDKLDHIDKNVEFIRDDIAGSIQGLTNAVDRLTGKIDDFIDVARNSVPIKAVFWLMAIMVLGLIGVEGIKHLGPVLKATIGG